MSSLQRFRNARRVLRRAMSLDFVDHEGVRLPPDHMRYCGTAFRNNEVFLGSGRDETRRLIKDFGMGAETTLLEIGCGPGRLPLGILAENAAIQGYDGVDIDAAAIDWCKRHITRRHPAFRFHHVEARHERYNPDGRPMSAGFHLNFPDDSFDIVYLHSVFANMNPEDVGIYCTEFVRVLKPGGQVFLTAFIEEDVPDITVNPEDYLPAEYLTQAQGPMNVARYEKNYFFEIASRSGLCVSHFEHGADLGGQSVVHLSCRPQETDL